MFFFFLKSVRIQTVGSSCKQALSASSLPPLVSCGICVTSLWKTISDWLSLAIYLTLSTLATVSLTNLTTISASDGGPTLTHRPHFGQPQLKMCSLMSAF